MAPQPMTLVERLRNPQWIGGRTLNHPAELDKEYTLRTMQEAAAEIERLEDEIKSLEAELRAERDNFY